MNRRAKDASDDPEADEIEAFYGSLPKVIRELKRGRWQNRIIAGGAVVLAFWLSSSDDAQRAALEDAQAADRVRFEKACDDLTDNARRFNALVDTLILRARQSTAIPDKQKAEAVRVYTAVKQTLPVCRPPAEETP